jgi:hypothetical protein
MLLVSLLLGDCYSHFALGSLAKALSNVSSAD